ncbi:P-loop containing nucleoside triphosphate hydrolase protein [Clavulina sp. PMI_390]|nr:P-loop containing nucleoside triphosphate hydrolase protein [Clavulina sp. PMI_390]
MAEDGTSPQDSLLTSDAESTISSDFDPTPLVPPSKNEKDENSKDEAVYLRTTPLSCYEMIEEVSRSKERALPGLNLLHHVGAFLKDLHYAIRFMKDCVEHGGGGLLTIWLIYRLASASFSAISLYFSSQLMNFIQALIRQEQATKTVGYPEFYRAAGSLIVWKLFEVQTNRLFYQRIQRPVRYRINAFFEDKIFQAKARLDLPTWSDPIVKAKFEDIMPHAVRDKGWRLLHHFVAVPASILSIISQVGVVYGSIKSEGGGWFALFAGLVAIFECNTYEDCSPEVFYVHIVNPLLKRMREVKRYVDSSPYRRQFIADGLQDFMQTEYRRARETLPLESLESAIDIFESRETFMQLLISFATPLLEASPTVIFAFQSLSSGKPLPLASLTLISSTVSSIAWQLRGTAEEFESMTMSHKNLKALYDVMEWENEIKDGEMSYPKAETTAGMKIEFRSVSFKYPREDSNVLSDLSFVIQPGQLCVIVGENGCGKTSTVNLLGRLYDVTEGQIFVDDVPIQDWRGDDLRGAQAVLYQDFRPYHTTLGENIGYGDVDQLDNHERIHKCAEVAGALPFIEKEPLGFRADIFTRRPEWSELGMIKRNGPLQQRINELERSVELSGGQWQRLAIARTYMRIMRDVNNGDAADTKLLCFDEPSSALDPKAEFELFEKLRAERGKRTLIFITHRFGHLTKHADVILYMKEGRIIEQGTHVELVALGGSYAHLYNVQAQAFQ